MKRNLLLISLLTLIWNSIAAAQSYKYKNYDWEKNPAIHKTTSAEESLEEIIFKEKHAVEFIFDENKDLVEYKLHHKITRVNSKSAIESNNKIYIPFMNKDFIVHKARVISPKGKVTELSDNDIKEAKDEESKATYRFFALDGLEIGSEIEHFYIIKRAPRYSGVKEVLQSKVLKKDVTFEIISPFNLQFKVKSYNDLPEFQSDTTIKEKNILAIHVKEMPALKEEVMSAYKASLQYLVYKLDVNIFANKRDIISYGNVSENIYKNLMVAADSKTQKKIKKELDGMKLTFAKDEEDKIRTMEFYLKSNYSFVDNDNPVLSDLTNILSKKIANTEGMVRLFSSFLREMKVDFQVVLTTERDETKFDPTFQSYNFLSSYLIYLPSLNNYIDPKNQFSCLGYVPYSLTNNYGLFIKEVAMGSFNTGVGKVQFIDALPFDKSKDNIKVNIDFPSEIMNPKVSIVREMTGYYAQYFQPYYSFYSEEDKVKVNAMIMKDFIENVEIKDIEVENEGKDYFGRKPFIIRSSFDDEVLVQKAGAKYMLKVGELIGRQMEMYQEEERKTAIENNFNRLYQRSISLNIPEGYKILNPEVLKMDVFYEENGERTIAFTSNYTLEKNKYSINIEEYYKKINFNKEEFPSFRKVINAAADFNKITLILEKI